MGNNFVILVPTYRDFGISGPYLGEGVYGELTRLGRDDFELVPVKVTKFGDSSEKVEIQKSIRGKKVYIIHPIYTDAAKHAMIAAETGQAAKMSDSSDVVLIEPYNRYSRQDRRSGREPVTARLIAQLYEAAGIDRIFVLDAHTEQVQMAFCPRCPIETLPTTKLLGDYIKKNYSTDNAVVCSPDTGAVKRSRSFANYLGLPMVIIHKKRIGVDRSEILDVIGDVEGKNVYIRDDVTTSCTTLINAAVALKEKGTRKVYACVTHLDIDDEAKKRVMKSDIHIIGTNTIPVEFDEEEKKKFDIVDIAPLLAYIIDLRSRGESIGEFFETSNSEN